MEGSDKDRITEQAGIAELQNRARRVRSLLEAESEFGRILAILPIILSGAALVTYAGFALSASSPVVALPVIWLLFNGILFAALCIVLAYLSRYFLL